MSNNSYEEPDLIEEFEKLYTHIEKSFEIKELFKEYDSTEELLENEGEKITEIREASEESPITRLWAYVDKELKEAYDAADWT